MTKSMSTRRRQRRFKIQNFLLTYRRDAFSRTCSRTRLLPRILPKYYADLSNTPLMHIVKKCNNPSTAITAALHPRWHTKLGIAQVQVFEDIVHTQKSLTTTNREKRFRAASGRRSANTNFRCHAMSLYEKVRHLAVIMTTITMIMTQRLPTGTRGRTAKRNRTERNSAARFFLYEIFVLRQLKPLLPIRSPL